MERVGIQRCAHCGQKVIPTEDGACPACGVAVDSPASDDHVAGAPSVRSDASHRSLALEHVVQVFTIEKGYAVLADAREGEELVVHSLDLRRFGYPMPGR